MTITGQCDQRVGAVTHCVFGSPLGDLTLVERDHTLIGLDFPGPLVHARPPLVR